MKRYLLILTSIFVLSVFGVSVVLASIAIPPSDQQKINENMKQLSECRKSVGACIGIYAACYSPSQSEEHRKSGGHHGHSCRECIDNAGKYFAAQEACRQHNLCLSQRISGNQRNPCPDSVEQELRERCENSLRSCLGTSSGVVQPN